MKAKECLNPIEPNRVRARRAAACLLALALLFAAGAAGAQTPVQTPIKVVDNTGQSSDVSTSLGNDFAQAFTTDSHRYGYWLTSVDIEFSTITTQPDYKVTIYRDNGGTPYTSALSSTLKNPASLVQGVNSFTLSENSSVFMRPDTTYWVALNVSSPGDAEVQLTASDSETGEPDWSIADLVHFRGYQSTGSWVGSITGHALKIAVHARKSPDRWGPVFSSASVNATTLKVTFDEPLDGGSAPAGSAFRVILSRLGSTTRTINGKDTVSIDGKTATVTLDGRVVHGEKVKVRYMEPATNPLKDAVGNKTADFSGKEADNETPAPMFSSASVNGTTLTVTFDLALDTNSRPAGSTFRVSATRPGGTDRTITGTGTATVSGKTATVTLGDAVVHGEALTVRYTAPGTGPLQDAAGNDAFGFTSQPADNDTPDAALPAATDATVYENTLTVTFNEALDAGSRPAGSAFRVSATPPDGAPRNIAGTGTVTVSGMTATVTLGQAVAHGEAVTVSYTAPGANPLQDAAGNDAEDFSGFGAANDTPAEPDTTPPALWSATAQGSVLVLTYSETLNPGRTPGPERFSVRVAGQRRTVTDVEIRGGAVVLNLASAVAEGQAVRLTYEVPTGSGQGNAGIQDYAGNLAGRIGNRRLAGDAREPKLVALTVEGAMLTLTYDEELDPSVAPPTNSFRVLHTFDTRKPEEVKANAPVRLDDELVGVTGVRVRGRAVILTLAKAVTGDEHESVRVQYSLASDDYRIQDYAGNIARMILYVAVTHGPAPTTRTPPPTAQTAPPPASVNAAPGFGDAAVAPLSLTAGAAMAPVTLPEAAGGEGELTYSLTSEPAGLAGLLFDPATRRLSGTPEAAGRYAFTYTAHDADENRAEADAATLTFAVTVQAAPDRAARAAVRRVLRRTLAAVGTRTLASALAGVNARFADAPPETGVRLAGREVLLGGGAPAVLAGTCPAERYERPVHERAALGGCGAAGIMGDELMRASAFTWTPASADAGETPDAPLWAAWGRGDFGSYEGRPEKGARYEGETRTGWLGFDMRRGPWVAGLALAHGTSEADYGFDSEGASGRGRLETTLTALYPYGRWRFANGLELRLVLGAGSGEARHMMDEEPEETGDLDMRMASVGLRRELAPVGGLDLAVRADASFVRMEVETGPATISGVSADTRRLRLGLEASRRVELGGGAALTPFLEAAARRDGGDGLTGSGVEIAGGARYTAPRLKIEARGRWLAAHSEDAARERGVSVTVRFGPGAEGRGLSFALTPRWGAPAGGAEALWRDEMPRLRVATDEAAVDAQVGYGFTWDARGLVTPFAETSAGGAGSRLRLGTRFEASRADLAMEFAGERTEREGDPKPVHGARLDVRYRF